MAKIIAETNTSPKQTTSRMSNAWSTLSSTTSHQHRLLCEQNTPSVGQSILITADLCGWASSTLLQANHRLALSSRDRDAALLTSLKFTFRRWPRWFLSRSILFGMFLLGWHQTLPSEQQTPGRKASHFYKSHLLLTYKPWFPSSGSCHQSAQFTPPWASAQTLNH